VLLLKAEAERLALLVGKKICEVAEPVEGKTPYVYEMRKSKEGKCLFYVDNQCAVYELRPLICRFYPFEMKAENGAFRFAVTVECPCVIKGDRGELDELFFEKLAEFALKELGSAGDVADCSR
jgi:Fe-S-cluster containining protein